MGNTAKKDAKKVQLLERRGQGLRLRIGGISYDAIAKQLGYTDRSHAARDIKQAIHDTIPDEERELLRKIENARLNALFSSAYPKALGGDWRAHNACQAYDRAIRELNGLDAPTQHELSGRDGEALTLSGPAISIAIEATPSLARQLIREKFAQDDVSTALPAASEGESGAPSISPPKRVEGD